MRLAFSLTPPSLADALSVADAMARRPDLDPAQRLAPKEWSAAASGALLRRDRAGLETLLRLELAPTVAGAMALLGSAMATVVWWPEEISEQWVMGLALRLDYACLALQRASEVVRVAEQWEALVDPERAPPTQPEDGAVERLLETASSYLLADQRQDELRLAVTRDLGGALRNLVSPAEALVKAMDAGKLDELITYPVQLQLYRAYGAGAAVLAYELALLGEGPLVEGKPLVVPE